MGVELILTDDPMIETGAVTAGKVCEALGTAVGRAAIVSVPNASQVAREFISLLRQCVSEWLAQKPENNLSAEQAAELWQMYAAIHSQIMSAAAVRMSAALAVTTGTATRAIDRMVVGGGITYAGVWSGQISGSYGRLRDQMRSADLSFDVRAESMATEGSGWAAIPGSVAAAQLPSGLIATLSALSEAYLARQNNETIDPALLAVLPDVTVATLIGNVTPDDTDTPDETA